jgi:hypothetical protein
VHASNACTAVGTHGDGSGSHATLAECWDGSRWTIQTTADPTGARSSLLSGVSCSASAACAGVGSYADSTGAALTLAGVFS